MPTNAVDTVDKTSEEIVHPAANIPLDLGHLKAQIAAELAAGLIDGEGVQERYGLSPEQWELLRMNPPFRAMVAEALQTWAGDMNAGQRITKKSEILLEDSLPVLDEIAHNPSIVPSVRIEAIKQMESLTNRKAKVEGGSSSSGFTLQINIGGRPGVTLEGTSMPVIENE